MKAPGFWNERNWLAWLLYPVSLVYGRVSLSRFNKPALYKAHIPVMCIGNLVAGGAGKTPTALAMAKTAIELGHSPVFLTRGFGGREAGPVTVDPDKHLAVDVGDEALLLARVAPTIVAQDRVQGAMMAEKLARMLDSSLIIMDDGFQNPYLFKDLDLVVVDAKQGIGNGFTMPAGPLRVPLQPQMRRADQFVVVGDGERAPRLRRLVARMGKASNHACLRPGKSHLLGGTRVLSFCGIGRPEKFLATLEELELKVVASRSFADHHRFTNEEAEEILKRAEEQNLTIVTTAKDHVRLRAIGESGDKLAEMAHVIEVEMIFDDPSFPRRMIRQVNRNFSRR